MEFLIFPWKTVEYPPRMMKVILFLVACIYFCEAYPNCKTNADCPNDMCCALIPSERSPRLCSRKPGQGNPCTGVYYQFDQESDDLCNCGPNRTCEKIENSGNSYYYCNDRS